MKLGDIKKILSGQREEKKSSDAPDRKLDVPDGFRVLVLDDMAINLKIMKRQLEHLGVSSVDTAQSASAALILAREKKPDVIFTDMWMPGTDGRNFLQMVRDDERLAGVPVIAVTADEDPITSFNMSGFAGVLVKPVTEELLSAALQRVRR